MRSASAGSSRRLDAHIGSWLNYAAGHHPLDRPLAAGASSRQMRHNIRDRPWLEGAVANPFPLSPVSVGSSGGQGRRALRGKTLSAPLLPSQMRYLRLRCFVELEKERSDPDDDTCAICLESLRAVASDRCVKLPCGGSHEFHIRCLEPWFCKCSLCPKCRQPLQIPKVCSKLDGSKFCKDSWAGEVHAAARVPPDRRYQKQGSATLMLSGDCAGQRFGKNSERQVLHAKGISVNVRQAARS